MNDTTSSNAEFGYEQSIFDPDFDQAHRDAIHNVWHSQELKNMLIIDRVTAPLSILGSLFVLWMILIKESQNRHKMHNKIMVCVSCMDILFSFIQSLEGIPAPKDDYPRAPGAMGNVVTCQALGFFGSLGFYGSTWYNASLALCYLLMVRYNWSETKMQRLGSQCFFLGLPFLIVFAQVTAYTVVGASNYNGTMCAAGAPYPYGCDNKTVQCERGGAFVDHWKGHGIWVDTAIFANATLFCVPTVAVSMFLLYHSVLKQEKANDPYRRNSGLELSREYSNQVAMQGIFYTLAFLSCEGVYVVWVVIRNLGVWSEPALYTTAVVVPTQGLLNAMVYMRPRFMSWLRKNYPHLWSYTDSCCCCCFSNWKKSGPLTKSNSLGSDTTSSEGIAAPFSKQINMSNDRLSPPEADENQKRDDGPSLLAINSESESVPEEDSHSIGHA